MSILNPVLLGLLLISLFLCIETYLRYKRMYKNTLKQSFSMTIAMGEYHMWIEDNLQNYLVQQITLNKEFLEFAKKTGLPVKTFEELLADRMKEAAIYIKAQSESCLRKVSEPLAEDINAILENQ